ACVLRLRPRPDGLRGMTRCALRCPLRQRRLVCRWNLVRQRFRYKRPWCRRQRFDPNIVYLVRLRGTERQRRTQRRTLDGPQPRRSFAYIAEVPQSGLELLAGHGAPGFAISAGISAVPPGEFHVTCG